MATINKNLTQTARDLGVSLGALLAANPQLRDPDNIRAGTQLNVPSQRKLSASENAKQMARIFSISSTGAAGDPSSADVARSQDRLSGAGNTAAPASNNPLAPGYNGPIQFGNTAAPATAAGTAATAASRAGAYTAAYARGIPPVYNPERVQRSVTVDTQGLGRGSLPGGAPQPPVPSSPPPTGQALGPAPNYAQLGRYARSGEPTAPTFAPPKTRAELLAQVNRLASSENPDDRRRAERMMAYTAPDSDIALEFNVANTLRERAAGRTAANASEYIWDEIASRRGLGETGAQLLIKEGYVPHPRYADIWIHPDSLNNNYSSYTSPGTSSYASRAAAAYRPRGGNPSYGGGSSAIGLYNWHIGITA